MLSISSLRQYYLSDTQMWCLDIAVMLPVKSLKYMCVDIYREHMSASFLGQITWAV